MQVIILGDVHLGKATSIGRSGIGSSLNSRIVDQLSLLDWTLDIAIDNNVESIIITGDIFEDPKPPTSLITLFIAWLNRCRVYGVFVHVITGNHDIIRHGTVLSSPLDIITEIDSDNVSVYKNLDTIIIGSTAFTIVPFKDRKSLGCSSNVDAIKFLKDSVVYELASIPETYKKVLIGHLAIEGSIFVGDEVDDASNELFCPLDMFNGYDYVWMGHVHSPQKINSNIFHIGSMDISNFLEADQTKHIVIFCCDTGVFYTKTLPTRPLRKFTITIPTGTLDSTAFLLNNIKKSNIDLNKAIVKLELILEEDVKPVKKIVVSEALFSEGVFNITRISESKKIKLIKQDVNNTMDVQMDIASSIKTFAEINVEKSKRAVYIALAMEILEQYKLEMKS